MLKEGKTACGHAVCENKAGREVREFIEEIYILTQCNRCVPRDIICVLDTNVNPNWSHIVPNVLYTYFIILLELCRRASPEAARKRDLKTAGGIPTGGSEESHKKTNRPSSTTRSSALLYSPTLQ